MMKEPINIDEAIDWDSVDLNNPKIDESLSKLTTDRAELFAILKRFEDKESELNYEEQEKYKMQIEESLEENEIWIDLLNRAIAIRNLTT